MEENLLQLFDTTIEPDANLKLDVAVERFRSSAISQAKDIAASNGSSSVSERHMEAALLRHGQSALAVDEHAVESMTKKARNRSLVRHLNTTVFGVAVSSFVAFLLGETATLGARIGLGICASIAVVSLVLLLIVDGWPHEGGSPID